MKILIISDSHGKEERINEVLKNEDFDYFFFLGDGLKDLGNLINMSNLFAVRGNCDFFSREDDTRVIEIDGIKFLLTHGDRFHVKSTLQPLIEEAKLLKADIVLYGHTHRFEENILEDITFINCPSLYKTPDGGSEYLILEIKNKKISISRRDFSKKR